MATSGIVKTNAYDSRYIELAWERTSYSIADNTSTIKWTLTARGSGKFSQYKAAPFKAVIDGAQVYYSSTRIWTYPNTQIATGTKVIKHNADGTKSFTASVEAAIYVTSYNVSGSGSFTMDSIPRYAVLNSATNFTDEQNPTITYSVASGNAITIITGYIKDSSGNTILSRTLDKTKTSYTFTLTDAERDKLRSKVTKGYTTTVNFVLTSTLSSGSSGNSATLSKTLTLVNAAPAATFSIADINTTTLALTGDSNKIISGYSNPKYTIVAEGKKGATITSYSVTNNDNKRTTATSNFAFTTNSTFTYAVTDSRGNTTSGTYKMELVEYNKLTCNQEVAIELVGETEAQVNMRISGKFDNIDFGAQSNSLRLDVRWKSGNGEYNTWQTVTNSNTPTLNNGEYTLNFSVAGLDYSIPHTFQCRATDKITSVASTEYTVNLIPVFDWSANDFNFNVPVNFGGTVSFSGNTMADMVIAQGTTNGWRWRKYKSGLGECWCLFSITCDVDKAWGSLYTSGILSATNKTYPLNFKSQPTLTASINTNAAGGILMTPGGGGTENVANFEQTGALEIARGTILYDAPYRISYHAIGEIYL